MKVLHLFSNAKWTGPAEPALNLCVALRRRGIEADFACGPHTGGRVNKVVETARDRGIEPVLRFYLSKHKNPVWNFLDAGNVRRFVRDRGYDLVHCHLDNAHRIAVAALRGMDVPIVRSSYEGEGLSVLMKPLLARTRFIMQPSQRALEADAAAYGYPREHMAVVPGAVDLERFDPVRPLPDGRSWLRIPRDAFVVGIVARLQTHRRYEDFFDALAQLVQRRPDTHAVVIGRGTKQEQVGFLPARERGIEERVHFPGYLDGDEYVGMLRAFDALVYLVPGSDGTCRTVREAMAMARPVVAADRGMLPEIVDNGVTGCVFDGSADGLFRALYGLSSDRARARQLGQAARAKAEHDYSLDTQSERVAQIYEAILSSRR